jgi:hypothetical protein
MPDKGLDTEIEEAIEKLPKLKQRQYATFDQLSYLSKIATKLGLYDADNFVRQAMDLFN